MFSQFHHLWERHGTFLRYVAVGILGTGIDLLVLALLTEWSRIEPKTSPWFSVFVALAFLAAVINNYVLNRIWTFKTHDTKIAGQFFRFLLVSSGGFILTQAIMWLLVTVLGVWYLFAKALTSMTVLIWNFGLNKLWTFRAETRPVLS